MGKVLVNETSLTGIGNAIRSKNGTTTTYKPSEMAAAISAIETGGGVVEVEEKDVNFYDYDGTRLYSYTLAEAKALTALPTPPEHEGLTFQEWNWTLKDVNALEHECDIGANYVTFDGATRLYINVNYPLATTGMILCFNRSGSGSINIDWGDGSEIQSVQPTSATTYTHMYEVGQYVITLTTSDENTFIVNNSGLIGISSAMRYTALRKVELGSNIKMKNSSGMFSNMYNLETISIPKEITLVPTYMLDCCLNLKYVVIPNGVTNIPERTFYYNSNLRGVSLPKTVSNIMGSSIFMHSTNLTRMCIPDACTTLYYDLFGYCVNLKKIILPSSMTKINTRVFDYCYGLEVVKFMSKESYTILHQSFAWSNAIAEYYFYATTPPTLESTSSLFTATHTKIYVPAGCGDAYKNATNWTTYADYIVEMEA